MKGVATRLTVYWIIGNRREEVILNVALIPGTDTDRRSTVQLPVLFLFLLFLITVSQLLVSLHQRSRKSCG